MNDIRQALTEFLGRVYSIPVKIDNTAWAGQEPREHDVIYVAIQKEVQHSTSSGYNTVFSGYITYIAESKTGLATFLRDKWRLFNGEKNNNLELFLGKNVEKTYETINKVAFTIDFSGKFKSELVIPSEEIKTIIIDVEG